MPEVLTALSDYEIERNKPMPNLTHGGLQANIIGQLYTRYNSKFRIASEVSLDTYPESSTPDVVVYPRQALNYVNEVARQSNPPLLSIEIQSPSQTTEEMVVKLSKYFSFGIKSCWIVFPAMKAIAVYKTPEDYVFFDHDDVVKDEVMGIDVELKKIFE